MGVWYRYPGDKLVVAFLKESGIGKKNLKAGIRVTRDTSLVT